MGKPKTKARKVKNEDGSVTVNLDYPFNWGDEERIENLTFQRPKPKHMKKMKLDMASMTFEDITGLAGKLCSQPPSVMDELDIVDLVTVSEVIEGFLPDGEVVGRTG